MAVLFVLNRYNASDWSDMMRDRAPDLDVRLWPDETGNPEDIKYVVAWNPPPGELAKYPNLKVIFSIGAGVDHLMKDPDLPAVPVVRVVDPDLTKRMTEYVVMNVLLHHRRFRLYDAQQTANAWTEHSQPAAGEVRVGIMGFGTLGRDSGVILRDLGFQVAGWSNSRKQVDGIESFAGESELDGFLGRTDILVSLLPHTPDTDRMLNSALFAKLPQDGALEGPFLINAGRGKVQSDADILTALNDGTLKGASLDVFEEEPLAAGSPLWSHPGVVLTPHVAAESSPIAINDYILDQLRGYELGEALSNVVNAKRGY
ncbi:MAG: glyoxylate/hydroxypyruvate reductase A [Alphaproteobacteria bacterium]|nr:glyoxylate/hydroxypyruvate reductase A [Alphaproteobacteria bacterium]